MSVIWKYNYKWLELYLCIILLVQLAFQKLIEKKCEGCKLIIVTKDLNWTLFLERDYTVMFGPTKLGLAKT